MLKKIVAVVMTAMMAVSFTACGDGEKPTDKDEASGGLASDKIELLKQDTRLTQDQLLSRIKAKKLIENNGYSDGDEVTVMVTQIGRAHV